MRTRVAFAFLMLTAFLAPAQAGQEWVIAADDWLRPRSGAHVRALPGLADAVRAWHGSGADSVLVIRHPGGEEGALWAEELRGWLVGLGVPSDRVRLAPGAERRDRMVVTVERRGGYGS